MNAHEKRHLRALREMAFAMRGGLLSHPATANVRVVRGQDLFWLTIVDPQRPPVLNRVAIITYCRGCLRLRNDLVSANPNEESVARSLWPAPVERSEKAQLGHFELTLLETELAAAAHDIGLRLAAMPLPGYRFEWPEFQQRGAVPPYAWSVAAKQFYDERQRDRPRPWSASPTTSQP